MESYRVTADEAIQKLIAGNQQYIKSKELTTDVSPDTLLRFSSSGQQPYAIIITSETCSL